MSTRKHMWGCWVVWDDGGIRGEPGWMWDSVDSHRSTISYYPIVFTETEEEIMPLVRYLRGRPYVKSAKAAKVPIPEGP